MTDDEQAREDVALGEGPRDEGFNKPLCRLGVINNEGEVVDSIVIERGDITGIAPLNLQVWLGCKAMELLSFAGIETSG